MYTWKETSKETYIYEKRLQKWKETTKMKRDLNMWKETFKSCIHGKRAQLFENQHISSEFQDLQKTKSRTLSSVILNSQTATTARAFAVWESARFNAITRTHPSQIHELCSLKFTIYRSFCFLKTSSLSCRSHSVYACIYMNIYVHI